MKRTKHKGVLATFTAHRRHLVGAITLALVATAFTLAGTPAANADTKSITFEPTTYQTGSIDTQDGWAGTGGNAINPTFDQSVIASSVSGFGTQSFRMSNAVTSGGFGDWPFSPSLNNEAGETTATNGGFSGGTRQSHFEASWDFASTIPGSEQAGLQISASPDRGDGARMSFIRLKDLPGGLSVQFVDYQDAAPFGFLVTPTNGCGSEDNFVTTTVASGLDRTTPHSIKLTMDLIDGARNDVVQVFVDGNLVHTGTSWEDYFRWCEGTDISSPNFGIYESRTVDSMLFQARSSGGTAPDTLGNGFLIDNLTTTSGPTGISSLGVCPVSVTGSAPVVYTLLNDCTTDRTIVVPQNAGGSTFDGSGNTITGIDPTPGHFLGAVVQAQAGANAITVKNLTVTVSNLTDACDDGANRLRGILFDGVSGTIHNDTVTDIEQGSSGGSGCQEGNAIDVRNTAGITPKPTITIDHNTVTDYQKTGIIATLSTVATITDNTVTGDGAIEYIAQNGIQVSFKATAKLVGNNVSLNNYAKPADKTVACGLLIYKAGGVSGATKSGIQYIKADNNFHDNEQNICNFGKGGSFSQAS